MRGLVLTHRDKVRLIDENVRRLDQRIAEESIRAEVFVGEVFLLLFVRRHALQPSERSNHREQQMQLGVLDDVALDEEHALLRVEAGGEEVRRHFERVLLHLRRVGVVGGERVVVGDEEVALVLVLHADPVMQRAHVVAEVQLAGRAHAAEHALFFVFKRRGRHSGPYSKSFEPLGEQHLRLPIQRRNSRTAAEASSLHCTEFPSYIDGKQHPSSRR